MKKWFFLFAVCICSLAVAMPIQDRRVDPEALSQLTAALGISEDADVIAETQKLWRRQPNQELWQIGELSQEQRHFVLNWGMEQGLFAPWTPHCKDYDKALILGATTPIMEKRLNYLKQLWSEGTRFSEIVWLTGDRPLDQKVDRFTDRCSNESEAAHILWDEADLPAEMRQLSVVFVAVPMKQEEGSLKRPNTEDTLVAWLKLEPEPCTALFVSDQPFCGYQFAVVKGCLPDPFFFDLVGPGADPTRHPAAAAVTLDCLARWIYAESLLRE